MAANLWADFFQRLKVDKSLKAWLDDVKVDGQKATTADAWQQVQQLLQSLDITQQAPATWARFAMAFGWNQYNKYDHHDGVEHNKALAISTPSVQDIFKQVEHIAKMAEFQLVRSEWRKTTAPAIERALARSTVDP